MSKTLITNAYTAIVRDLNKRSSKVRKIAAMRYFKTGKGQYGEGDEFIGVTVPDVRKVSLKYAQIISEEDIKKLLKNNIHEYRLAALMILDVRYTKARKADDELCMKHFFTIYMSSFTYINNWDLVDQSARDILGAYSYMQLPNKGKEYLFELSKSSSLWKRRASMVACHYHIREESFEVPLYIASKLLGDTEDLIHKAVGWMLREVGVKSREKLVAFIEKYAPKMSRTTLRYAIEHFDPKMRKYFLGIPR